MNDMSNRPFVFDRLPAGFLEVDATELHEVLPGPSLIHMQGDEARPLFVSTLLHGNETTGFQALQTVLKEYAGQGLPRALSVFIGNVAAAAQGLRVMPGQSDYNRIWPDAAGKPSAQATPDEAAMTARILQEMRSRKVFASLDLHNTSGRNPHHACVTRASSANLHLASLFSRQILFFETPSGVQNMAFGRLCPAVTAECGQAGRSDGVGLTAEFLNICLHMKALSEEMPEGDFELYRSMVTVRVPEQIHFSFGASEAPLRFVPHMDGYNWRELPAGTEIAEIDGLPGSVLDIRAPDGRDMAAEYLVREGAKLRTRRSLVPAMLSLDEKIIRQDCLCYFLERVS